MSAVTESIQRRGTAYIAGPMRNIKNFNFPAFYAAEAHLACMGYAVINPARLDAEAGFNPAIDKATPNFIREAFARDLAELCECDAIALLPGWEHSEGARIELAVAQMLGIEVISAHTGEAIEARVNVHVPEPEDLT